MEIRELDIDDDAALRRYYEIMWRAEREDGRPWNPMWTFEEMAPVFRTPPVGRRVRGLTAHDPESDEMVGVGFVMMPTLDNLDTAWVFVGVEPALRGRGIGAVLARALDEVARGEGRTQLIGSAAVPFEDRDSSPVVAWAERQGYTVAMTEIQRDLAVPVDPALLDALGAEAAEKHAGYDVLTFTGPLPEELVASYCAVENSFNLEAPHGEVTTEAGALTPADVRADEERDAELRRLRLLSVAVRDGSVVAYSQITVSPDGEETFQQGTLVSPAHRGHRLGLAVKVANLRALAEHAPQVTKVMTTNAETNAWMVAINERLGFVPVAVHPTLRRVL
jgi:GNAT superfamily N-acetyltransferase